MQETQVQPLGWEGPLEEVTETHSSIPAWRIPWAEEPGWPTVHGVTKTQIQLSDCTQHAQIRAYVSGLFTPLNTKTALCHSFCSRNILER